MRNFPNRTDIYIIITVMMLSINCMLGAAICTVMAVLSIGASFFSKELKEAENVSTVDPQTKSIINILDYQREINNKVIRISDSNTDAIIKINNRLDDIQTMFENKSEQGSASTVDEQPTEDEKSSQAEPPAAQSGLPTPPVMPPEDQLGVPVPEASNPRVTYPANVGHCFTISEAESMAGIKRGRFGSFLRKKGVLEFDTLAKRTFPTIEYQNSPYFAEFQVHVKNIVKPWYKLTREGVEYFTRMYSEENK